MTANQRTFVLLEDGEQGGLRVKLVGAPRGKPGNAATFELPDLPDLSGLDAPRLAKEYGQTLLSALRKDSALRKALGDALRAGNDEVRPLCFKVDGETAAQLELRWEALYDRTQRFLALNHRWPIGRFVESDETVNGHPFEPPLRILAVMSGSNLSAEGEWRGLREAIKHARGRGLLIHATVIVGEEELHKEISEYDPQSVEAVMLTNKEDVRRALVIEPHPHVMHFFCHGLQDGGHSGLAFATRQDHAEPPGRRADSVKFTESELTTYMSAATPWLVTLNCCEGGLTRQRSAQSLAQALVAAGAGAALGWREIISPSEANTVSESVYARLLEDLATKLVGAKKNTKLVIEPAAALIGARELLRDDSNFAADALRWTWPVLFVSRQPLSVIVTGEIPDHPENLNVSTVSPEEGAIYQQAVTAEMLRSVASRWPELAESLALLDASIKPDQPGGGE